MATLFVDKIDPQSGTSLEIGSSGDTITIPSGATITNNGTQTGFGGTNTPAFSVRKNTNQDISNNTATTVTWQTEDVDTDSAFASNTFTVPSDKGGVYFVYAMIRWNTDTDFQGIRLTIRKNSTNLLTAWGRNEYYQTQIVSGIINLSATDTVDVQCKQDSGGTLPIEDSDSGSVSIFSGFKLI